MSFLERVFFFHQETLAGNFPNSLLLARQFEISTATAKRDISYLRDRLLAPLAYDQKKHGYYYTTESFHLPFTESPRIVFLLAMLNKFAEEAGLGGLNEVKQLKQRLAGMVSSNYRQLLNSLKCQWIEVETIDHQVFETIIEAVAGKSLMMIEYLAIGGEQTARTIEPLQILNYQGRWYLFAFCRKRHANRLFHIGRIKSARLSSSASPFDRQFDNEEILASFGIFSGPPRYLAEILFTSIAADLVRNQHWHKDQQMIHIDDGLVMRLPVCDDRELVMKVLQYGSMAKVLSPPVLIDRVRSEIAAMSMTYPR